MSQWVSHSVPHRSPGSGVLCAGRPVSSSSSQQRGHTPRLHGGRNGLQTRRGGDTLPGRESDCVAVAGALRHCVPPPVTISSFNPPVTTNLHVNMEFSHEDKVVAPMQFSSKPMKSKLPSLLQIQRTEWALTTNSKLVTSWWRWITSVKIELVTRYYTNTKWVRRWLITERFQADLWVLTTHPQVLVTVTKVVVRALPKEYWGGDRVLIRWVFRSHPKC